MKTKLMIALPILVAWKIASQQRKEA